jgi:cbb3-type cytochrome oxidase subunit 1
LSIYHHYPVTDDSTAWAFGVNKAGTILLALDLGWMLYLVPEVRRHPVTAAICGWTVVSDKLTSVHCVATSAEYVVKRCLPGIGDEIHNRHGYHIVAAFQQVS